VPVLEDLPSSEASESNEATTKKERRVTKKLSMKPLKLLKHHNCCNRWLLKEIPESLLVREQITSKIPVSNEILHILPIHYQYSVLSGVTFFFCMRILFKYRL
jgi:hypothetical protein